jgi:tetratricopeptide (TPR) repeat protein
LVSALRSGDPCGASDLVERIVDASGGNGNSLRPTELSLDAVRTMLADAELDASESYLEACWQATGGNPFLVTELVGALRGGYAGDHLDDAAVLAEFAPHSVGRRVVIRIRQLGDEALKLCRACAVLGDRAAFGRVASVAGLDLTRAALVGERLIAAHVLESWDPTSFVHPMIGSAVHNELPADARLHAHTEAARVLCEDSAASEEVARHLLAGAPIPEQWAWRSLHAAARDATQKGAPRTALRYLELAIELCPAQEVTGEMLVDLGLVEAATGEATSLARFERALGMLDEPTERAPALHALGETLYRYGRHAEAAATFRRGADSLADSHDDEHHQLALAFEGAFMCGDLLAHDARRGDEPSCPARGADMPGRSEQRRRTDAGRDSRLRPCADDSAGKRCRRAGADGPRRGCAARQRNVTEHGAQHCHLHPGAVRRNPPGPTGSRRRPRGRP